MKAGFDNFVFIGYISLQLNYPLLKKSEFRNPLGIAGAVYSLCVWILGIIGVCGFQGHYGMELGIVGIIVMFMAMYYWIYSSTRQTMSSEESKILLVAHISKFNARRRITTDRSNHSPLNKYNPSVYGFEYQ